MSRLCVMHRHSSVSEIYDAFFSTGWLHSRRAAVRGPGARNVGPARPVDRRHDTLMAMASLAATVCAQGDLAGARKLEEQVLEARRRLLGDEHPDTVRARNNPAQTMYRQGDLAGARELQEHVLEARRRLQGDEHPYTSIAAWNLFLTLRDCGDASASEKVLVENLLWLFRRDASTLSGDQRGISQMLSQMLGGKAEA